MLKYLRIAVTALSLMACVLLVALWVRSYWRNDMVVGIVAGKQIAFLAAQGNLRLDVLRFVYPLESGWRSRVINDEIIGINPRKSDGGTAYSCRFFNLSFSPRRTFAWMPFWIPVSLAATLAAIPWLRWSRRFSLRTLLIATTLVAVGLGVIAMSS